MPLIAGSWRRKPWLLPKAYRDRRFSQSRIAGCRLALTSRHTNRILFQSSKKYSRKSGMIFFECDLQLFKRSFFITGIECIYRHKERMPQRMFTIVAFDAAIEFL